MHTYSIVDRSHFDVKSDHFPTLDKLKLWRCVTLDYSANTQVLDDQMQRMSPLFIRDNDGETCKMGECGTKIQPIGRIHFSPCEWAKGVQVLVNVSINDIR